jgi:predicted HD phosphohydrolase
MEDQMQSWRNMIEEAYEGKAELRKSVEKIEQSHARDAARFSLPDTYVAHMVLHDLMHTLHDYMQAAQDEIQDPRSFSLLKQVQNIKLDTKGQQLKQLARIQNIPS